jgi:drug/metabolite transporter (DMT)-like permease
MLALVAFVWGASYLFIKVAVGALDPFVTSSGRMLLGGIALSCVLCARIGVQRAVAEMRALFWPGVVLGLTNAALPWTLISWGETHVDSGVAAIANSTVPIFVVLLAIRFMPSQRVGPGQLSGILVGLTGVAVLTGVHPHGGWLAVAGTGAVVASSLSYAVAGLYGKARVMSDSALVLTTNAVLLGGVMALPFALARLPSHMPGWKPIASVVALGLGATAFAQPLYYLMLRHHGASRASLVTYLLPPVALFYGAVLLDEKLTWPKLAGLALILAGVALGSGLVRLARRAPAAAA